MCSRCWRLVVSEDDMEKDTTSLWAEIKKYEDALARDPGSYCFAPLAELYRRMGLVDDAVVTAQKGVELHPDYVGGHLALGRAFADKGMKVEARQSLERVIRFTPENLLAQKVLSQLYLETGENELARRSLEVLLDANPNDSESRITLESLDRAPVFELPSGLELEAGSPADLWPSEVDDYLVELHPEDDIEELAELELVEELDEPLTDASVFRDAGSPFAGNFDQYEEDSDDEAEEATSVGIRTATLAELYLSQGHPDQALDIYRELAALDPHNGEYGARLAELTKLSDMRPLADDQQPAPDERQQTPDPVTQDSEPFLPLTPEPVPEWHVESSDNDREIAGLERWLENIRRVRGCHSEIS